MIFVTSRLRCEGLLVKWLYIVNMYLVNVCVAYIFVHNDIWLNVLLPICIDLIPFKWNLIGFYHCKIYHCWRLSCFQQSFFFFQFFKIWSIIRKCFTRLLCFFIHNIYCSYRLTFLRNVISGRIFILYVWDIVSSRMTGFVVCFG